MQPHSSDHRHVSDKHLSTPAAVALRVIAGACAFAALIVVLMALPSLLAP